MSDYIDEAPPEDPYAEGPQTPAVDSGTLFEQRVIGAAMRHPRDIPALQQIVAAGDFHDLRYGAIFDGIARMHAAGEPVGYLEVWSKLTEWDVRNVELGDLSRWHDEATGSGEFFAQRVREASMRRLLADVGQRLSKADGDVGVELARAQQELRAITEMSAGGKSVRWLREVLDVPEEADAYDWVVPGLLERGDRLMLSAAEGSGKALALDTPLPTPTGWTTMGGVEVGDMVLGADGKPTRVTFATEVQYDRECYRVEFSDGSAIVADAEHLWLTSDYQSRQPRARSGAAVRTTAEIAATLHARDGFCLNHSITVADPLSLPDADLPIDPYVLGAWLGDGSSASAEMTCHEQDAEIFDHFRAAGYTVTRKASTPHGWWVSRSEARETALVKASELIASGMSNRAAERATGLPRGATAHVPAAHSSSGWRIEHPAPAPTIRPFVTELRLARVHKNKHIPTAYLRASFEQRLALLQGLMDTDGTVSAKGKSRGRGAGASRCEFSVTNERLARGVHELVTSLGIIASFRESDATINGRVVGRRWRIGFQTDLPVFRLRRKLDRIGPLNTQRSRRRFITAVVPVESVPVRCIQVDNADHLYLAGWSMIPTHNTTLLRQLAILAAAGIHPFEFHQIDPVNVLVVDAENSERQWRRAARKLTDTAAMRGRRDPRNHLALHTVSVMNITRPNDLAQLHRWIDECKPSLMLLGPLYRVAGGSSLNTDEEVAPLLAALDSIRDRGVAMLLEVHAGHARSTSGERELRPRGSSALLGWPEFGLGLRRDKTVQGRTPTFSLVRWRGDRDRREWPRLVWGREYPWEKTFG